MWDLLGMMKVCLMNLEKVDLKVGCAMKGILIGRLMGGGRCFL